MTAYAIGHLRNITMNTGVIDYLHRIDATLAGFGGRFIIHGGPKHELEGSFTDDLIVIAFPDLEAARSWYGSASYQAILPLRRQGAEGEVFLIEGVDPDHKATDILQDLALGRVRQRGVIFGVA
ncbi:DUF1330 domain-containing protein [Paracoccus aestuariivivens]|uniref:DUF1330 domain-containing protein n=1 Tax=Paracoccus aestuariivivens TaxID=1820333 RepID=A0A6L6JFV7_9RHOB|nr:DUF1330 domain-containing protein [Paracoccus aestuariivivens]MTH80165.1 DUF1330 domain-containing protein [Paracoccus aestuariivivens]